MGEQTKNMLIGIFVLAAVALLVSFVMFLKPSVGDGKKTLYVRFANINKITVGTRVTFAGEPVGEVVAIDEIPDARKQPSDRAGEIYFYQLTLKVDSSVDVYNTDEISLQTSGLLGEKSVAIVPKVPPPGVVPHLVTSQPIYAISTDPIENAFEELSDVANDIQLTFQEITRWIKQNGDQVASTIKSAGDLMDEAKITVKEINQEKLIEEIKTATHNFSQTMHQANLALEQLQAGHVFVNTGDVMRNIKSITESVKSITHDIDSGKGTIGRLIKYDDMYLRVTAIMTKMNTLMDDVNNYGVLFHLNKGWQRTHSKRIDLLNALDTPGSFKTYFQSEVDEINTAMGRLSMVVDKAEESPEREKIFEDPEFQEDFMELLRQVEGLSDNLQLYSQELLEATKK